MRTTTEYGSLRRATGVLAEVVDALPGYGEALAAQAVADRTVTTYLERLPPVSDHDPSARLLALLESGEPLPDDLPALLWTDTKVRREQNAYAESVCRDVVQRLAHRVDGVLEGQRDRLTALLDERLKATVEEARGIDVLGAEDADSAIDAGVGAQWARLRRLRADYRELRAAQSTVLRLLYGQASGGLRGFGFLANYAEMVPGWLELQAGRRSVINPDGTSEKGLAARAPWMPPHESLISDDPDDTDDDLRLDWLLRTPEAVPWIATPKQIKAAEDAAVEALWATATTPDPRLERQARKDMEDAKSFHAVQLEGTKAGGGAFGEDW